MKSYIYIYIYKNHIRYSERYLPQQKMCILYYLTKVSQKKAKKPPKKKAQKANKQKSKTNKQTDNNKKKTTPNPKPVILQQLPYQ